MLTSDNKISIFKALGEPTRIKIVEDLLNRDSCKCVCELSKRLGKDQSVIYRHVQILERAGILSTSKEANKLLCCISNKEKVKRILEAV